MQVKEIMSQNKVSVAPSDSIATAAHKMNINDIGCLLVEDGDKLVGILTDRDIVCKGLTSGLDSSAVSVRDVMSQDLVWCLEDEDVEDAIRLMEKNKVRRLPVMSKEGLVCGLISVGDISTHLSYALSGEVIAAVSSPESQPIALRTLN